MKDSGVAWMGEVPADWEVTRLKFAVLDGDGIQMGPFGGMLLDLDDEDTGYKVYGQENTISGDFTLGSRWVSEDRFNELKRYSLGDGDVVLTHKGSLGNARLIAGLDRPGIADSDTIRIRANVNKVSPCFLELLLHNAGYVAEQILYARRGAVLAGLNTETIANITLVLPPIVEQTALLDMLTRRLAEFDDGIDECSMGIELLKERRTALISAAVTGKIDVRGSMSAPATLDAKAA
ncbi:MAG: hypothetical protein ROZ37_18665 [Aromatoleum sp.]|jgi:type I restriction enzyme S subunit|uniref:hypothetical protein n=1 Tax=Aromatoleum sp. TaxID=2307007 RepID=UPI00289504DB|nr:hypothetical protein [Aromatoleum sp.]MDT3672348.1 hypothetical protein [Aromatoleum sp.]